MWRKTPLDGDDDEDGDYDMKEEDNVLLEEGTNYVEIPNLDDINGGLETFDIDEKMNDENYNHLLIFLIKLIMRMIFILFISIMKIITEILRTLLKEK